MPIYTCDIVGTGIESDPFRLPYYGDGDSRIGGIILSAPGSKDGVGLLWLPEATQDIRLTKIGDAHYERMTGPIRSQLQNKLILTLRGLSTMSLADVIAEVMQEHGEENNKLSRSKWGTLLPSKIRGRYEIHLGSLGVIGQQQQHADHLLNHLVKHGQQMVLISVLGKIKHGQKY